MKKILVILGICFLIILFPLLKKDDNNNNNSILYSWDMDALSDKKLFEVIKKHKIDTIYQDFSSDFLKGNNNAFFENMQKNNITIYHLCGEENWGLENDASSMKKEIDKVINYNKNNKYQIKGIVFDIEPYQNEKNIENFNFELYVTALKEAYKYANQNSLLMVIAIPIWFDTINDNLLRELIKDGCDEVSLMNYNIKYVKENMENEILYAMRYNKDINTIYEINFGVEDYFPSYESINDNFKEVKEYYSYSKLRKAYHHYEKMR